MLSTLLASSAASIGGRLIWPRQRLTFASRSPPAELTVISTCLSPSTTLNAATLNAFFGAGCHSFGASNETVPPPPAGGLLPLLTGGWSAGSAEAPPANGAN